MAGSGNTLLIIPCATCVALCMRVILSAERADARGAAAPALWQNCTEKDPGRGDCRRRGGPMSVCSFRVPYRIVLDLDLSVAMP